MNARLPALVTLTRPFTLLPPLVAGVLGTSAPLGRLAFAPSGVLAGLSLAILQAGGQAINQAMDADLDVIIKPYRPIPSGKVGKQQALVYGLLLLLVGTALGFAVSLRFGLAMVAVAFFAGFYSLPPLSPRRRAPLETVFWLGASRGFLPMFAVTSIYGTATEAAMLGSLAFLWTMAYQSTKDVLDAEEDRKFGYRSLPNEWGMDGYNRYALAVGTCFYVASAQLFPAFLLLLPMSIVAHVHMARPAGVTENSYAWASFYAGIALMYLLVWVV